MGCDIHLFVEKKIDGQWHKVEHKFDVGRNYQLFSVLADVRNEREQPFIPMAEAKGLPDDASSFVYDEHESWGGDAHSASWHTLEDILAFNWTQVIRLKGWVNGPEFEHWDRVKEWDKSPRQYCSYVGGGGVSHVSEDEMRTLVSKADSQDELKRLELTYCLVHWDIAYAESCMHFWYEAIPELLRIGKPDEVRIVFWFDN